MMKLELDDETADILNQLATEQHLSPAKLVKAALSGYLEGSQDSKRAEAAYQAYLDGGKVSHSLDDVVKAFGLDS